LERLLDEGLVEAKKRGTAWHWRKRAGASGLAAKAVGMMTYDEALALQTLRRFSSRRIPTLVAETLTSIFVAAEQRIEAAHDERERRYRKWVDEVERERHRQRFPRYVRSRQGRGSLHGLAEPGRR
jgi:hypothetical protein